jgi:predicted outer membrane repeat protein
MPKNRSLYLYNFNFFKNSKLQITLTILITLVFATLTSLSIYSVQGLSLGLYNTDCIVDNTNDSGAGSLRQAIDCAEDKDTITFDASLKGEVITLLSTLIIDKDLIIDGASTNIKIDGNNTNRVFEIKNKPHFTRATVGLKNLTIQNGKANKEGELGAGGGIFTASKTALNIDNVQFLNNHANGSGGGAIFAGWKSLNTIINSHFSGNTTDGNDGDNKVERGGGAIAIKSESSTSIQNSTFHQNSGTVGGAINSLLGNLVIKGSTFTENNSTRNNHKDYGQSIYGYGGAIYTDGASATTDSTTSGSITIEDSKFDKNSGQGQGGGLFLFVYDGDFVSIKNSVITNNKLSTDSKNDSLGGGVRIGNGEINIENTLFANNQAQTQGGGLWLGGTQTSSVNIEKNSFIKNQATGNDMDGGLGGAVGINVTAPVNINKSTFVDNLATFGGAFWGGGNNVKISDSIFDSNEGTNKWKVKKQSGVQMTDGGNNFEWPEITIADQIFPVTSGNIFVDPKIAKWEEHKNTTPNHPCHGSQEIPKTSGSGGLCSNIEESEEEDSCNFSDVPINHTFYQEICNLKENNVINGYSDNTFRSELMVTRGEMAKFIVNAFNLIKDTSCVNFADAISSTFAREIQVLKCLGISKGNNGRYLSNDYITRAEAIKLIVKAAESKGLDFELTTTSGFVDVLQDSQFYQEIYKALSNDVISGQINKKNQKVFRPQDNISRGEVAKIVDKISQKLAKN